VVVFRWRLEGPGRGSTAAAATEETVELATRTVVRTSAAAATEATVGVVTTWAVRTAAAVGTVSEIQTAAARSLCHKSKQSKG
jgi:hypothetical protein